MRTDLDTTAVVLNDQLGRGRSSTTAVIVLLIQRWLKKGRERNVARSPSSKESSRPKVDRRQTLGAPKTSWQIINSCLRVIRSGLKVKRVCAGVVSRAGVDNRLWTKRSTPQRRSSTCVTLSKIFEVPQRRRPTLSIDRGISRKVTWDCCRGMQVSEADEQAFTILGVTTTSCCSRHIWMIEALRRRTRTRSSLLSSIDQVS